MGRLVSFFVTLALCSLVGVFGNEGGQETLSRHRETFEDFMKRHGKWVFGVSDVIQPAEAKGWEDDDIPDDPVLRAELADNPLVIPGGMHIEPEEATMGVHVQAAQDLEMYSEQIPWDADDVGGASSNSTETVNPSFLSLKTTKTKGNSLRSARA
uniref:Uncharacterized protein n=1 Tax=Chromera velia CCMP2878 TaxID=1169474 RepID=A0A0G4IBL0_9ALVE|mmetsp:Transcript_17241/g.34980  ORF Transcript_17241/g.34980 Transcript_17241/m.34980 type:complete len:155 (-) Transcript_17241:1199-1663(-)|eukprot:Cvel_2186.t1-p1 / transcript=Cvel_2186.t1 / gene=Cvel_2186 / organism=Chromera_velia_CCMP2878 / gene_product=hypothetical protein / transcript_product=hypothetical protein / location=Cvel_scaffold84:138933-140177(-) / protein_length=154 / sequence_SO=supercontig / SO=protein_coding / is_pseudo=false